MATYDERLTSFEPRKPKSQKKSAVNTAISKGWPHPESFKARPSTLAHAGFYFDPTSSKNDNVTCFMCEHSLGEWTQDDDPFAEHLNVAPKCAWAIARCNIELDRQANGSFRFTSSARLPTSKAIEKARADTFKGFWIHDQVKGHTANSKKMAKAGWIFNPGDTEDSDLVTCFYCGKNLDGWEQGDDPTLEHKTRNPNCPVFTAKLAEDDDPVDEPPVAPIPATAPESTTSKSRTQPATKRGKGQNRTETPAISDANDTAAESDAPSQPKRGRSKPSAAAASSNHEIPPPAKAPATTSSKTSRRGTSRSVSTSRKAADEAIDLTQSDVEEIKPPPKKVKGARAPEPPSQPASLQDSRDRKSSKNRDASVDINTAGDEEVPVKPSAAKKKSKKKGSKKSKSTVSESGDDLESEVMEVDVAPVIDVDATPLASDRNSLSDWNKELEAQARELHIEEEFAAIDNKRPPAKPASSIKTKLAAKVPSKSTNIEKASKAMSQDRWAYRDHGDAKSVMTEMTEDMTEEEEVEKSLAEDDFDDEDIPSPPPSRPASVAPSVVQSTVASTTVSSKTKVKVKELKSAKQGAAPKDPRHLILQQDEDMADMSTPKARSRVQRDSDALPSRPPPPLPVASFDTELKRTESVSSGPTLSRPNLSNPPAGKSGAGLQSMLHALDEPMIAPSVSSYELTAEEREMTLEEWIKFNIERQMEEVRREGRKWIEEFLEEANATREEIRAL